MRYTVWSVLLFLGQCARGSTYPELCFPVYYDGLEHSTWQPNIPRLRNYTMFQQFCIKNSTANLPTSFTQNASWSHDHHSLADPSRYHINNPLRPYWKDGQLCVNSSITLLNVTEDDHGVFTVAVSTTCGSHNDTYFTLEILPQCGMGDPRPVNPTQKPVIVSNLSTPLSLSFQFQGDSRRSDYTFYLMKSGEILNCILCMSEESECENLHVSCYRDIPQCNTTLSVQFNTFTKQDEGKYCVAPSLLGSGSIGNMSCVELDIQQSDQSLVVPLAVSLGVGVPVIIIITIGCIVVAVYKKQSCQGGTKTHETGRAVQSQYGNEEVSTCKPLLKTGFTALDAGYQSTQNALTPVGIDSKSYSICDSSQIKNGTTLGGCEALWQTLPNTALNTGQLQKVSQLLDHWEPLARVLGLEQPDIIEIQEDYPRNYKKQKIEMLRRWSQEEKQASLKSLVRCVEVELRDRNLAQKIVTALK